MLCGPSPPMDDGMGSEGVVWDGMEWCGMGCDGVVWDGMGWNGMGMEWSGIWVGLGWCGGGYG